MNYQLGFWVLCAVLAVCAVSGVLILDSYDRTPIDILHRVLGTPTTNQHYVWLPDHYTSSLKPPPHTYSDNVRTLGDFYEWKGQRGGVLAAYEDRPTIHDVTYDDVHAVETRNLDSYTFTKHTVPSFFDSETVIFYELLPAGQAPYNAVFVIPGSGHPGAADVLGEPGPWQTYYYQDSIAKILAKAGYAVYVMELRGYGERAVDVGAACNPTRHPTTCSSFAVENKMVVFGISMADIRTDEATQVLAYIESRPYIRNVAVAGLSLGAGLAVTQAIINGDIVDAVVMASGVGSNIYSPVNMESTGYEMISCCDTVDQIATIAPMPAYVSFGTQESTIFRWEAESGYTGSFLADVYQLHDASENFYYVAHNGTHEYHTESILDFLNMHMPSENGLG